MRLDYYSVCWYILFLYLLNTFFHCFFYRDRLRCNKACVCVCVFWCDSFGVVAAAQNTCLIFKSIQSNRFMKMADSKIEFNRLEYPFLYRFFLFVYYLFVCFIWIYWLLSILVLIFVCFFSTGFLNYNNFLSFSHKLR